MKRKFLFAVYETPQGKLLQVLEKNHLKCSMTVSYKQTILQIGSLGWESDFVDCSLYKKYSILDSKGEGCADALKICAKSYNLPIQSETVDLVIVPHLLEFDPHRFHTMREIERVLKPEGEVVILNLNPLSIWVRWHLIWNKKMTDRLLGHFITRTRISDWLKLLNFEIKTTSEFTLDTTLTTTDGFKRGRRIFFSMAYAVRAVKRQYTLIPITPIKARPSRLVAASSGLESSTHRKTKHD